MNTCTCLLIILDIYYTSVYLCKNGKLRYFEHSKAYSSNVNSLKYARTAQDFPSRPISVVCAAENNEKRASHSLFSVDGK